MRSTAARRRSFSCCDMSSEAWCMCLRRCLRILVARFALQRLPGECFQFICSHDMAELQELHGRSQRFRQRCVLRASTGLGALQGCLLAACNLDEGHVQPGGQRPVQLPAGVSTSRTAPTSPSGKCSSTYPELSAASDGHLPQHMDLEAGGQTGIESWRSWAGPSLCGGERGWKSHGLALHAEAHFTRYCYSNPLGSDVMHVH